MASTTSPSWESSSARPLYMYFPSLSSSCSNTCRVVWMLFECLFNTHFRDRPIWELNKPSVKNNQGHWGAKHICQTHRPPIFYIHTKRCSASYLEWLLAGFVTSVATMKIKSRIHYDSADLTNSLATLLTFPGVSTCNPPLRCVCPFST